MSRVVLVLAAWCGVAGALVPAGAPARRPMTALGLFGGGKKEGGGALSNVAGMMDQFKKAQEIAKKSAEIQAELAEVRTEGTAAEGRVKMTFTGQQQPVSASVTSLEGFTGEALSAAFTEAMKDAQTQSLELMNEKMTALYASVGLGGAPPAPAPK